MNELDRLIELSEFRLDYSTLDAELDDLTDLASRISGAKISLINLVDRYTQWTVARCGLDIKQMPREDSVCQYTINQGTVLEIKGLKQDPRFKDKEYVCGGPDLDYYYGVPLRTDKGANIGALCVLDKEALELSKEQRELLGGLSHLVVRRLESIKRTHFLEEQVNEAKKSKRKMAHDIRGPISGILGLVDLLKEELKGQESADSDEMLRLIENSGESVIELASSILGEDEGSTANFTCQILASKIEQLYAPQAKSKDIKLLVEHHDEADTPKRFAAKSLLQIGGNLVNNAIKFTPEGGSVFVRITVEQDGEVGPDFLRIEVVDNGIGMSEDRISEILRGQSESTAGTEGERGYGLGLPLVRELVEKSKGSLDLQSKPGDGCKFTVRLPI